jgi:Fe2+ or Zn2+ uptake regulation protein
MKKGDKNTNRSKDEALAHLLQDNGLKITQGRISILEVFSKYHKPLNAEGVSKYLKGNKVDEATIYRTLKSFEEKGILRRVDLRNDSVYFEMNEGHHHHHHLVCKQCGDIEDVDVCEIDRLSKMALMNSSKFKLILDHSLEFFGVCKACNKG